MKQLKKLNFLVLIIYLGNTLFFILPVNAKKYSSKKSKVNKKIIFKSKLHQKKQIDYKKKIVKENLKVIKLKQKSVASELIQTQKELEKTQNKLSQVQFHLAKVTYAKDLTTKQANTLRKKFSENKKILAKRIVEIYKYGEVGIWEVLLHSENFWDFLNRLRFLRHILASDSKLLAKTKNIKEKLEDKEIELTKKQRKVAAVKKVVENTKTQLNTNVQKKTKLKQKLSQSRAEYEQMLAQLEATSNEIEKWIQKYLASQKNYTAYNFKWTGKWLKPVPGRITSGFGYRVHPIYKIRKMHTGIDFAAAYGTSVHASASGIVIYAGWWGGYGKVVIISHGSGVATLYGHNSSLAVSSGQKVKAGQLIAYVGSTGLSTGPHCHFEVRKNGVPVNPY